MPREAALLCNFIEITRRHGCSPVNFLRIFRTPLYKNTFPGLLLYALFNNHSLTYMCASYRNIISPQDAFWERPKVEQIFRNQVF